ncbi:hypothetical protein SAMD00019534_110530 [Acytostelium subglobosum LB1]|uniref:hypothetical protein n=1 Tax=Acytostelium subglobosum LB1 TaxID=1410327 RepID=UPI0006450EA5|nr:hypothetical protein SAMD00019534_110530 [Acytostelium subglobosum LB1]GAM27877.1 hypothetical protein SAMD00019534_110530 [Acytostelium subglobosum LB1]|eukprot:XP_012749160.1 hypothetical protein SAMD00019534_110530 [Acytostelium subglobosum LB1]
MMEPEVDVEEVEVAVSAATPALAWSEADLVESGFEVQVLTVDDEVLATELLYRLMMKLTSSM